MSAELVDEDGVRERPPEPPDTWSRVKAAAEEDQRIVVFLFKALLDYLVEDSELQEQILINAVNAWVAEHG